MFSDPVTYRCAEARDSVSYPEYHEMLQAALRDSDSAARLPVVPTVTAA